MAQERFRRPPLDRTAPIRNWTTAVSPGPSASPIGPDVQNANRVIEDYLRAGEASARLFQGALGGSRNGAGPDLAQAMMRAASDMMSYWMQLMTRSAGNAVPTDGGAQAGPPSPPAAQEVKGAGARRVSVEVDSIRPAIVTVDLRPQAGTAGLTLERLHRQGAGAQPLTGARIESSPDGATVIIRLTVKPAQPAGIYHGVIVDEASSLPVGTISIEVKPGRGSKQPSR